MGERMETPPAFFMVFLSQNNNKELRIPPAFYEGLKDSLPDNVRFRDQCRNVWNVKVAKVGDGFSFIDGWEKFAQDNSLETFDMLEFEYYCDSWFAVRIFGPSGTEKNVIGPSILENHDQVVKHGDDEKENDNDADGNDDDDDDTESEDMNYIFKRRLDNEVEGDNIDNDDEEDYNDENAVNNDMQITPWENNREVSTHKQVNTSGASSRRKKRILDCYGSDIFLAGLAQQPTNPYFVTTIMQKRKGDLFVPKDVIKDFGLDLAQKDITLVDPTRRHFPAKCRKWSGDGRIVISGGWKNLCRLNLVSEDDQCICEFEQEEDDLILNISFVRGNGH